MRLTAWIAEKMAIMGRLTRATPHAIRSATDIFVDVVGQSRGDTDWAVNSLDQVLTSVKRDDAW